MSTPTHQAASQAALSACGVGHGDGGLISDLVELTKVRLTTLVLITTFTGFVLSSGSHLDLVRLFHTLAATGLVAGAAAVLNQVIETDADRLMARTRNRPLPAGRISRSSARILGISMAGCGLACMAAATTATATLLAATTLFVYLALYTPMKRRTSLCVCVGAVSGAIPPVIGWASVNGSTGPGAWVLFGVLFCWQMPHFLSIAWLYRDQYSNAGFRMLHPRDGRGTAAAAQALLFSAGLAVLTSGFVGGIGPHGHGWAAAVFLPGALMVNAALAWCAGLFLVRRTTAAARRLFFASVLYLPAILGLLLAAR